MLALVFPAQTALGCCGGPDPSAFIVLSPLYLSFFPFYLSAKELELKSENRRDRRERRERDNAKRREEEEVRRKAQMNVPNMVVKEIIITLNEYGIETWQIRLEDPTNQENYAVLTRYSWPETRKNRNAFPEEKLQQGDRIVFEVTELGNGWYIYDDRGEKITYIPVSDVQLESFSEKF